MKLCCSLWYDRPAEDWTGALPLGNGRLGAMVYGGVEKDHILLNEKTIWAGPPVPEDRPDAREHLAVMRRLLLEGKYAEADQYCDDEFLVDLMYHRSYQPLGTLRIEFDRRMEASEYERVLDIGEAVATVSFQQEGVRYRREAFVSPVDEVIVVRLTTDAPGHVNLRLSLDRPASYRAEAVAADTIRLQGQAEHQGEHLGTRFEGWLKVVPEGGMVDAEGDYLEVKGADAVTLLLAAATDYNIDDPDEPLTKALGTECRRQLEAASGKAYRQLRQEHVAEHQRLFNRVALNLDCPARTRLPIDRRIREAQAGVQDPELLLFYFHYCRYIFISSARPGTLPSNLQGVWNPHLDAPWNSDFHTDINVQENYWFAEPLNLAECHEPFFELTEGLLKRGRKTARSLGCRGFVASASTDAWFWTTPPGSSPWGMWIMGAAWNTQHYMEHYRFTLDRAFLEQRAYPILKEASAFFVDWLVEDPETGDLVSGPSVSPENWFLDESGNKCSITMGCSCDQEIIWETFRNCLEAAQVLGIEDAFIEDVTKAFARLALPKIGSDGRLMEWPQEFKEFQPGHRHVSHLFGMMPGSRISLRGTPELADAVRKSVDARLANDYHAQGWSLGHITALLVRLGQGDRALELVERSYSQKLYPNLFVDAHGNVQVGDMMGVPAAMAEMLLQSQDGEIHLLPALPDKWTSGSLQGFCARRAFTVDMNWEEGKLKTAVIHSNKGGVCTVRYEDRTTTIDTEPSREYHIAI